MAATVEILHIQDQKATTVDGGSNTGGSDIARTLNTVLTNEITGASLGSNQITLPAGTYFIDAIVAARGHNRSRLVLYNTSDSADEVIGMNHLCDPSAGHVAVKLMGVFTIAAEKVFELRHFTTTTIASTGFGLAADDGTTEVYADVVIEKTA